MSEIKQPDQIDDLTEYILRKMERDHKDRNTPGLEIVVPGDEHNCDQYLKRLPDGRWYEWMLGSKEWHRNVLDCDLEAAYQAGRTQREKLETAA